MQNEFDKILKIEICLCIKNHTLLTNPETVDMKKVQIIINKSLYGEYCSLFCIFV